MLLGVVKKRGIGRLFWGCIPQGNKIKPAPCPVSYGYYHQGILSNGWGNDESYLKYFLTSQVFNARVITGFERTSPNVTNVTVHTALILLGSLHGEPTTGLEPLAKAIRTSGIPAEVSEMALV